MRNMPMCPMMMGQMPMMAGMPVGQMPMGTMPMTAMPMGTMPMMQQPNPCMKYNEEDDRDEEYFAGMEGENCHKMMPFVKQAVDKMEQNGDMIYQEYPEKQMIDRMSEEAYNNMIKDMPDMADEMSEERQFGGRRRFGRDLVTLLLLNELLRRRRRRRRHDHWDNDYNSYDYGYDDYYYYE